LERVRQGRNVRIRRLRVRLDARGPKGVRVRVTCSNAGCRSFSGTIRLVNGRPRPLDVWTLNNRVVRDRVDVRVSITLPGSIGIQLVWRVRNGRAIPAGRKCLPPGSNVAGPCG
jgi:hypothetical protein